MPPQAENPKLPGYRPKTDPRRRCANCRCTMRPNPVTDVVTEQYTDRRADGQEYTATRTTRTIVRVAGYGYGGANFVCTLTCGYKYGRRRYEADASRAAELARVVVECDGA